MTPTTLSTRALSRATLARQYLLRRARVDAAEAVEHLVGLQTQLPQNHYTALWSRLEDFDATGFPRRFEAREFVRISLQRSTILPQTSSGRCPQSPRATAWRCGPCSSPRSAAASGRSPSGRRPAQHR